MDPRFFILAPSTAVVAAETVMVGKMLKEIYEYERSKKRKNEKVSSLLIEKFMEAWKKQEDRLSKLEQKCVEDTYGPDHIMHRRYEYENGIVSETIDGKQFSLSCNNKNIKNYDELGNCILMKHIIDDRLDPSQGEAYVYYPNSKQKEFEWTKDGIKHFDKDGVEDTKVYFAKARVEKKKEAQLEKLEDKPKLQKAVKKISESKAFNDIAMSVAKRKLNKSQGK